MSDILKRLKTVKLTKKNIFMAVAVAFCVVVLLAGEISGGEAEASESKKYGESSAEYIKKTQRELETVISDIDGAGDVQVMITLESCYENVYAKGYSSKNQQDENEIKSESQEEYIVMKKGSNNEESLVIKVYEPQVKGVAVVCSGGDDINVKTAITETVCALFGISSAKVSVTKMNNR